MRKVIVKVTKEGKVSVKTEGFLGSSCLESSKFIEDALGVISSLEYTNEYYQEAEMTENICLSK